MMARVKTNGMDFGSGKGWHFCRKCRGLKSYSFLLFIVVALTGSYSQAYEWKDRRPSSNVEDLRASSRFSSFITAPAQPFVGAGCLTYLLMQTDQQTAREVSVYVAERMAYAIQNNQSKVTVPGRDLFRMGYNKAKLSVELISCYQEAVTNAMKQSLSSAHQAKSEVVIEKNVLNLQQGRLQFLRESELIHQIDATEDELLRIVNQDQNPSLNKPSKSRPAESNSATPRIKDSKRKGAIQ